MEQTTQQIIQKPSFPIKTKIAALWLIGIGILIIVRYLVLPFREPMGLEFFAFLFWAPFFFLVSLFFFIPALFLLLRNKIGWYWSIVILFIIIALLIGFLILPTRVGVDEFGREVYKRSWEVNVQEQVISFIIFLFPFVLLLLDRENFWKIAT